MQLIESEESLESRVVDTVRRKCREGTAFEQGKYPVCGAPTIHVRGTLSPLVPVPCRAQPMWKGACRLSIALAANLKIV